MFNRKLLFVVGEKKGNTASRARGAELSGWTVFWSIPPWTENLPFWRRVPQYRLRNGPDVIRYNDNLLKEISTVKPDIVWVETPMFVFPETISCIKDKFNVFFVCAYSDDPRDLKKISRHFDKSIVLYDVIFATKDSLLQHLFDNGAKYTAKFWKGYDPARIYPRIVSVDEINKYGSNIVFIGHADYVKGISKRKAPLEALAHKVAGIKIWGRSWGKAGWPKYLNGVVEPMQADGDTYTKILCAAKVAIQIPSRLARDTHSSRSVEIPATRTMMIAERTLDHQVLFDEDKEAVFFGSIDELVDKAKYYINNETLRNNIANSGYERCLRSGYSNYERMKNMLLLVCKIARNQR